jgi:transaldolase
MKTKDIFTFGQSVWYDNISRDLITSGELTKLVDQYGVRGMTSNPTIFDKAISKTTTYDSQIKTLKSQGKTAPEIFEEIAIEDCGRAADLLLPMWESSKSVDGWVSIEVSPLLATDTKGTIEEAIRLHKKLSRKNIMIKVPGTPEGIPAVRALLEEGISVNITLLFSVPNYIEVAKTYIDALETRATKGLPIDSVRSVASFFVSRVDSSVDAKLETMKGNTAAESLLGKFGIANSRIAYQEFTKLFTSPQFKALEAKGALPQRPLWASTGVKNPKYRDVQYIEELIGPETVNTMPPDTLMAFADHGNASVTITKNPEEARKVERDLTEIGVDLPKILQDLQDDGVKKFSESFESLMKSIQQKIEQ